MSDLITALSRGLARFVYAWLGPSILAVGLFTIFVLRDVRDLWPFAPVLSVTRKGNLPAGLVFAFTVLALSVLFAYASLPIYRFLEGYSLPKRASRVLRNRQLRRWRRLQREYELLVARGIDAGVQLEKLQAYPETPEDILPTRLGNALRAMERYGDNRYGLDSQSLWFELEAAVPAILLKDYEDARATVDFFVSSIAHLALLGVSSVAIGVVRSAPGPLLVGMVSLLLTPVAYEGALRNMGEWRDVVQAMVNTGRLSLAGALGLSMPDRFSDEIAMWSRFTEFVNTGDTKLLPLLDRYRYKWRRPARQTAGNTPPSGPLEEDSNGSP